MSPGVTALGALIWRGGGAEGYWRIEERRYYVLLFPTAVVSNNVITTLWRVVWSAVPFSTAMVIGQ